MKITNELIESLNPCTDRHQNYLKHYRGKEFSVDEFLDLENITYEDKMWVCMRLMNDVQNRSFAILCADSVLHIYESEYPNDKRPRDLIEYLKIINWSYVSDVQLAKIASLLGDTVNSAAAYVAYAAAYAAAAYASTDAYSRKGQQDLNLTFLKMAFSL